MAYVYRVRWQKRLYDQALSLPSSSSLTEDEQSYVIAQIEQRS